MTIEIRLGNSIKAPIRARVGAWCDARMSDKVSVENREKLRSFDPSQLSEMVKVVISVITLLVEVWPKKQEWNQERLRAATAEALLNYGILDFEIVNVEGYSALKDDNKHVKCTVEVRDKRSGQNRTVSVSRDGSAFVMDV
jgi:hypothetical protein